MCGKAELTEQFKSRLGRCWLTSEEVLKACHEVSVVIALFWLLEEYQIQISLNTIVNGGMGPCSLHHSTLYLLLPESSLPINTLVFCSQDSWPTGLW